MKPTTINAQVGEYVHFMWGDELLHDVILLKGKAAYDSCNTHDSGVDTIIYEDEGPGIYTVGPLKKGTFYYACAVLGHCASGQKVTVVVT